MRLSDKKAIITGAASGIGAATVELFVQEGAQVVAVDLSADRLVEQHGSNTQIICLAQDVAGKDAPETIINAAINGFGGVDILVNNAGLGAGIPAEEMTPEIWQRQFDVHTHGSFWLCHAAFPFLQKSAAGRIINIASVMATHTDYGLAAYCASKAAITGYTRNLALEWGKYGITANCVLPGAIYTGMTNANFDNPDIAAVWAKKSPLKRLGQPLDIARGILFLASDDGGFVTGQDLNVDGGMLLRT